MKFSYLAALLAVAASGEAQKFRITGLESKSETKRADSCGCYYRMETYYRDRTLWVEENIDLIADALVNLEKAHTSGNHGDVFYYYNLASGSGNATELETELDDFNRLTWEIREIAQIYGSDYLKLLRDTTTVPSLAAELAKQITGDFPWKADVYYPGTGVVSSSSNSEPPFIHLTGFESTYKPLASEEDKNLRHGPFGHRRFYNDFESFYSDLKLLPLGDNTLIETAAKLEEAHIAGNHGDVFYYYNVLLDKDMVDFAEDKEEEWDAFTWELKQVSDIYGTDYLNLMRDTTTVPKLARLLTRYIEGDSSRNLYYPGGRTNEFGMIQGGPEVVFGNPIVPIL